MVFNKKDAAQPDEEIDLPCGQCVGCRLERSRQWAIRIMHEAQMHSDNSFLTLTFDEEHLPENLSISKRDLQLFMKRLRKKYPKQKIRYYACGEYGDINLRPHYHLCMFNYDPIDKQIVGLTKSNHPLYESPDLKEVWPYGRHWLGELTFESAAYVARYVMKKMNGQKAEQDETYKRICSNTGEIFWVEPEFQTQSLKPAIGQEWFDKYSSDAYPSDYITVRGRKMKPPKFYDKKYEELQPVSMIEVKENRMENARENYKELSTDRLNVKHDLQKIKQDKLIRENHNG